MNQDLLPAIFAAPDDDRPRLVWADWLEERGDPARAELVRVQCALARAEPASAESVLLRHRERRLLAQHGRAWLAEVGEIEGVRWTRFERGLLVGVEVPDLATLIARADEIRARAPVTEVTALAADLPPAGTGAPALPWLRALTFHELYQLTREQLEPLLDSPLVDTLRTLRLVDCGVENPGALAIAASPRLRNLEQLDLTGCFVGEAGGIALAGAEHLRGLRQLRFGSYGSGYAEDPFLTDAALDAFADPTGPVRPLEELNLDLSRATSAGVRRLLGSDRLPRLRRIHLKWCSELTAEAFAIPDGPARWRHLVIDAVDASVIRALAALPQASELHVLSASGCPTVGVAELQALVAAPLRETLRSLVLSQNRLDPAGFAALTSRPWPALVHLDLQSNPFDAASAARLTADRFPALRELDLRSNPVGDDGAAAIARQLGGQLVSLNLRQCQVGAPGARALAESRPAQLAVLSLAGNDLRPDGAQAVGAADWPALAELDLAQAYVDDDALQALAASPTVHRLLSLDLSSCTALTPAGVGALAAARPANLRALSLAYNHLIRVDSVHALCEPGAMPQLTHLTLASCGLDEAAFSHLERSALYEQLTWLSAYGNQVRRTHEALARKVALVTPDWRGGEDD